MENLRIIGANAIASDTVEIKFTHNLTQNLVTSNIEIEPNLSNVPVPKVLKIQRISQNILTLICQPLTEMADFFVVCKSLPAYPFQSTNGEAKILEDSVANKYLITAPIDENNPIKLFLESFLEDNIYNHKDTSTVINSYLSGIVSIFSKALYDIKQTKNEVYLSYTIQDEEKVRTKAPFERLNEESAYEVIRVGLSPTGSKASTYFDVSNFNSSVISLQQTKTVETLKIDSINYSGIFNVNDFVLNLSKSPVIKLDYVKFYFKDATTSFYDISSFGYQLLDSKYDKDFASTYVLLEQYQLKLNDKISESINVNDLFKVEVSYYYKDLGKIIFKDTINVYDYFNSVREVLPPIINVFELKKSPIIDSSNNIAKLNAITFEDPNNIPGSVHPAFKSELPFSLSAPPKSPGQYSIDYSTGTVYVFGESYTNDGTGPFPPLATYKYKYSYKNDIDYVYDEDNYDLIALSSGNLFDSKGYISFDFEKVLVPNVDYKANLHVEELSERVENRLVALNALKVKNYPITNAFRVLNETTGEIYTITRWNNDKIYFRYLTPPKTLTKNHERASFKSIINELLFVNTETTNTSSLRIFKINLKNNTIISSTEDSLGSSINSSVIFSESNIFKNEKWFNTELSETNNINRLKNVGEYIIDYINGIIYCAVDNNQNNDIGFVSYKFNSISTTNSHILTVDDLYYQINELENKDKSFNYVSFDEGSVIVDSLDRSDELYLNDNSLGIYQISYGDIGVFSGNDFVKGVTNRIKYVRGVFEHEDMLNSTKPLNFSTVASFNDKNINVGTFTHQETKYVQYDGVNYYILIDEISVPYLSTNISYSFNVTNNSLSYFVSSFEVDNGFLKLILSNVNNPQENDLVFVNCLFTINDLSRVIVDYNKGDFFIDYGYVHDELIVSYEYGDNALDFRQNTNLPENTTYYVSYKVGALRDALVKNFGTLVNIEELFNIDLDFNRERYRDALSAALSSFIEGPTVSALKNIAKTISHVEPELKEYMFEGWDLGTTLLAPRDFKSTGDFELLPSKFGNGVLIDNNKTIELPAHSNIRLEEGTFESWITPSWDGIDNDANLTLTVTKDGYAIDPLNIFIGYLEEHPKSNTFTTNKSIGKGAPNLNKDGVYIFYDKDISSDFNRWYLYVVDGYSESPSNSRYAIKINSNGSFYDQKALDYPKPSNIRTTTTTNSLNVVIDSIDQTNIGLTFVCDVDHYVFDVGNKKDSRLSLYKDPTGYLVFKAIDKNKVQYYISYDVSSWRNGQNHFVSASWKLNNKNNRDEMHLFIDGFEVPNIIKFGKNSKPYLHEKYRTVNFEEIIDVSDNDIISFSDLKTTQGSAVVTSSINFSGYNISVGDTIFIDEDGFDSNGYLINVISGQSLTLNSNMPATLSNVSGTINRKTVPVSSEIDVSSNFYISTIHSFLDGYGLSLLSGSDVVTGTINFENNNVLPGYLIKIDGVTPNKIFTILAVDGYSLTLNDFMTITDTKYFNIYTNSENEIPGIRALNPSYSISKVNGVNYITFLDDIIKNDILLLRTLGLNHQSINRRYYVWSDNVENIIRTRMPDPINLDDVNIKKIILPRLAIGPKNSTYSLGYYVSSNIQTDQPSNAQNGRTLSVTITGDNVDFSDDVEVTINGVSGIYTVTETINFTDYGTLNFANQYVSINYIQVTAKVLNPNKNALAIEIKEKYNITHSESSGLVPVIRYSYPINYGYSLYKESDYSVRDDFNTFSHLSIGNYLLIGSPTNVAGFYKITDVSSDRKSLTIEGTSTSSVLPLQDFIDGTYQVLNVSDYRSGLQNGFFTFENELTPSLSYLLTKGFYEFEYNTYTSIKFNPLHGSIFFGSDINGKSQLNGLMNQLKIYSTMLTDTRVGENVPSNQRSITKDFNSLKPLKKDANTIVFCLFDSYPFTNQADFYATTTEFGNYFQSNVSINDNFGNSLVMNEKPIVLQNEGILDTKKEATIEFWVNPFYDTGNDPNVRYYFDASSEIVEETVSTDNCTLTLSNLAERIIDVKLFGGDPKIDYFSGGSIEIDTVGGKSVVATANPDNSVTINDQILQVISVKILNDYSNIDYFDGGVISADKKTIYLSKTLPQNNLQLVVVYKPLILYSLKNEQVVRLNKKLPNQNSKVIVRYVPKGMNGDKVSIFKDNFGYINFLIRASGFDYTVRAPTNWAKNTWHRVKASYKINSNADSMKLFIDGYSYSPVNFGDNLLAGDFPGVFGLSIPGLSDGYSSNINFKDQVNTIYIGNDNLGDKSANCLIDNFRISNIFRKIYAPYGEALDVNYSSNLSNVYPVTSDLYTTYLIDFYDLIKKIEDFTIIRNRDTGSFDFQINVFDSFGIVGSSPKVKQILEKLINILKPAHSRVFIKYKT